MIGKLRGIVDTVNEDSVIIDVGGVGYHVFASSNALRKLPQTGGSASFIIETHVREDHIHLYGFLDQDELEWFRNLTTVQGVGTRLALSILSALNTQQLVAALASQDKSAFKNVGGVGPKLSERLVTELKGKVKTFVGSSPIVGGKEIKISSSFNEAISALVNLGYNRSDAYTVIAKIAGKNDNMPVGDLVKGALKELAR